MCCRNVFQCKWLPSYDDGGRSFKGDELEQLDIVSDEQKPEESDPIDAVDGADKLIVVVASCVSIVLVWRRHDALSSVDEEV
jgi:hypothetical protein